MKKTSFIIVTLISCMILLFWLNCNQSENIDSLNLKVLDESGSSRLTVTCTIDVNGSTWDGGGQTLYANTGEMDSPTGEEVPYFRVTNGTVKNFTISVPAYNGIYLYGGNCTVDSVTVPDVGETFIRVSRPGTYNAINCTANRGNDKIFQINDLCTITTQNINVTTAAKFMRQNGGKTWKMTSFCIDCTIMDMKECLFRSDSAQSIFYYRNLTTNSGVIGYPGTVVKEY